VIAGRDVDAFADPPIEVIRGHVQASDLFYVAMFLALAVFSFRAAADTGVRWFLVFALLYLGLCGLRWAVSWRSRIEIHRSGLVRRHRLRAQQYHWGEIAAVVIGPGRRFSNPRPAPVLVLVSGKRVELVELKPRLWSPVSDVSVSPEARAFVDAVRLRIDPVREPEPTTAAPDVSTPPRPLVVIPLVACLAFFVIALAAAMVVVPFVGSTADVDPAKLPAGRVYHGSVDTDGVADYWVECPRPVTSAVGSDPICRQNGRDELRNSVLGIIFCAVCAALLILYVRHLRRRYQRWNEVAAGLNA
jgi:hypothetical protein